jgi:hypothetical protein
MVVVRILVNALIMAAEIAAVAAVAYFAYRYPFIFAGVTAGLSFLFGLRLEIARLRFELPFYFGGAFRPSAVLTALVGFVEATFKGVLAGVAALFTFSGTDPERLMAVAILFGVCVYAGASGLRLLDIRGEALPLRWGYFRLAPVLGLMFSAGIALLAAASVVPQTTVGDIGWKIIFDTPARPSIEQVSELFFQIKQAFDDFVVTVLSTVMDAQLARIAGVVISVNVLSGFVSALYAAMIATAVRKSEDALLD